MPLTPEMQQKLQELLDKQTAIYRDCIPLAQQLAQQMDASAEQQDRLQFLDQKILEAIGNHEQANKILRDRDSDPLSPGVKQASKQLETELRQLMPLISKIEERALMLRQSMSPEIRDNIRSRKMLAAYSSP